ncbi:Demethylmenaquinone methyltransferase [Luteitalea pratensis]|uniref:Demethylmenaquinone methyltransferase n=1 Tax=Luteitalea pratensis TaxID=1855912 RepID=A0A143PHG1_LUTPR|nr:class I SAM-dependent methyltransferase [Luteitalea pratensis]AMY07518.1 Demethylmenaquinone methyltransferase [Luteitalea pratensis]
MTDQATAYAGPIPAQYDDKLRPMFFEPYARDIVSRMPSTATRVLEVAAGTGIVSRALLRALPPTASLMVTDLQPGMLDVAAAAIGNDPRVEIRQADALSLPFGDAQFVVVCQFGVMLFSDKIAGLREIRRVLTPGGAFLMNTWGSLEDNPVAGSAHEEMARAFPDAPPQFLSIPFGLHDAGVITGFLHHAGFSYVQSAVVECTAESRSAHAAAMGVLCGTPLFTQLQQRGVDDPRRLVDVVAARLAREGGFAPMRLPMKALVFTAQ